MDRPCLTVTQNKLCVVINIMPQVLSIEFNVLNPYVSLTTKEFMNEGIIFCCTNAKILMWRVFILGIAEKLKHGDQSFKNTGCYMSIYMKNITIPGRLWVQYIHIKKRNQWHHNLNIHDLEWIAISVSFTDDMIYII